MHRRVLVSGALVLTLVSLSMPFAWAKPSDRALVVSASGAREVEETVTEGGTVESREGAGRIVFLPDGARLRLGANSRVRLTDLGSRTQVELQKGTLFGSVPDVGSHLLVRGPQSSVRCSAGTFVYDVGQPRASLRVMSGDAVLTSQEVRLGGFEALPPVAALKLSGGFVGLTGPDVIDRSESDVEVGRERTQPETETVPPPVPPPATPPAIEPLPPAVPPAVPPPPTTQVDTEGGGNALWLLALLGAGGLLAGLLADGGGGGGPQNIPISP